MVGAAPPTALQSGFATGYYGCAGALLVAAVLASARGRVTAPVEADPITLREDDYILGWPAHSNPPPGS